jgi:hypothetical protein
MTEHINRAVDRLAEALHELAYQGRISITPEIRMLIHPGQARPEDAHHLHSIGLTAELADLLADLVEKAVTDLSQQRAINDYVESFVTGRRLAKEVDAVFSVLDVREVAAAVLDETDPKDRPAVNRALNHLFGGTQTQNDQETEG